MSPARLPTAAGHAAVAPFVESGGIAAAFVTDPDDEIKVRVLPEEYAKALLMRGFPHSGRRFAPRPRPTASSP
jgi:hypothetical protein